MATQLSICNTAIMYISGNTITALTDGSVEADYLTIIFDDTVNEMLMEHPWSFALERTTLSGSAFTPSFEYSYAYTLPTDCLKVIDEYNGYDYKREGGYLLTDESSLDITYVKEVTDFSLPNPWFNKALSASLAMQMAFTILGSVQLQDRMTKMYSYYLMRAKTVDARQNPKKTAGDGSWITKRSQ